MNFCPLPRPNGLLEVDTVLDIGAGIQPIGWYKPKRHICVEPHAPYAEVLRANGYEVVKMTAWPAMMLQSPGTVDAIYMLDMIEHVERKEGLALLDAARALQPKQIVISTPFGYHEQHVDEWEMGGEHWQTHRSGWVPDDFPGWSIQPYHTETRVGFLAVSP